MFYVSAQENRALASGTTHVRVHSLYPFTPHLSYLSLFYSTNTHHQKKGNFFSRLIFDRSRFIVEISAMIHTASKTRRFCQLSTFERKKVEKKRKNVETDFYTDDMYERTQ